MATLTIKERMGLQLLSTPKRLLHHACSLAMFVAWYHQLKKKTNPHSISHPLASCVPVKDSNSLPVHTLESISTAVTQIIGVTKRQKTAEYISIDAVEHLRNIAGRFVYRIVLSKPRQFSAEQTIQFRTDNTHDAIQATVLLSDENGVTLETHEPLPTDAKLVNASFDPSFIYRATEHFLKNTQGSKVSGHFLKKRIEPAPRARRKPRPSLNGDQSQAIDQMTTVPIHLLWGPPGTGKTTTLGAAVAEWMKAKKRVLVVSTSNAAVDVAVNSILKRTPQPRRKDVLRLGTTLDKEVDEVTITGKLRSADYKTVANAREAQDKLSNLAAQLSQRTLTNSRFQELIYQHSELESAVMDANENAAKLLEAVLPQCSVVACTLAKMVLDRELQTQEFDIVVIDEVSMVSVVYALAASTLSTKHLVLAGDPRQLPPICPSDHDEAKKWFGQNCYDWFDVAHYEPREIESQFSFLKTQYRMTTAIGNIVSDLSYGGELRHGRLKEGANVEFVDVPDDWSRNHYSVSEKSYYNLISIPIIHELAGILATHKQLLLLTPFQSQQSLFNAMKFDLQKQLPDLQVTTSTIHRSQGSESKAVILDLTTHDPSSLTRFFREPNSLRLFNVGISRAQEELVILGNLRMLQAVADEQSQWKPLIDAIGNTVNFLPAEEIFAEYQTSEDLVAFAETASQHAKTAIYSHPHEALPDPQLLEQLKLSNATRKLLILGDRTSVRNPEGILVRENHEVPETWIQEGLIGVPANGLWLSTLSPNACQVVWRLAFSHLAEDEVNPLQAKRFFCPECANGNLNLSNTKREGWFLVCSNSQSHECYYRRRLSIEDAKIKVRLTGMSCPHSHPLTARKSGARIFIGCENYPECDYTASLTLLAGM